MTAPASQPRRRSFWLWLTVVYLAVGFVGLAMTATMDPDLAVAVAVHWGLPMPGLILMTLGTYILLGAPARFIEAAGWLWLAGGLAFIWMTSNAAVAG